MTKAAIYARFSTELQNDRSIDDQIALCRAYADRNGIEIAAIFDDRARSGASLFGREGLLALMDEARDRAFDIVIVEALDRLSRDQEDLAGLWKRLTFFGIEIRAVHDGRADAVQIGLRGLVGALYLQDLAHKVRRGLAGRVRDGRSAGGRAYGYRPVPGKPGELQIMEEEAAIVRRIFAEYLRGRSPRAIAGQLNRDGVPPPRGECWNASTINGSLSRGTGILNCELYAGRIVWNKVRMLKDPETGRRVSRVNPKDEWLTADAPALAIVDRADFEAVAAIRAERRPRAPQDHRRPKHLLSGLLKCGACGGGMSVIGRQRGKLRIGCSRRKESGTCGNGRTYGLERIEALVIEGLKSNLDDPRLIAGFVESYNAERKRLAAAQASDRMKMERRLAHIERGIARAAEWIVAGNADPETLGPQLRKMETERRDLTQKLAKPEGAEVIALHPGAIARYRAQLEMLHYELSAGDLNGSEAAAAFRALIDSIVIDPAAKGIGMEVRGHLAQLIGQPVFPQARLAYGVSGPRHR